VTLATPRPLKTVGSFWPYSTTLWDYVNRAMPFDRPGLLEPSEVYSAVAYVLNLNRIVDADQAMNATTLPRVQMPNRDGFVADSVRMSANRRARSKRSRRYAPGRRSAGAAEARSGGDRRVRPALMAAIDASTASRSDAT
jgi:hypothetical protein